MAFLLLTYIREGREFVLSIPVQIPPATNNPPEQHFIPEEKKHSPRVFFAWTEYRDE